MAFCNVFKKVFNSGVPGAQLTGRLDIITASGGGIYLDGSALAAAELGYVDGVTAGTVTASKALVVDANKAIGAFCLSNRLTTGTVAGSAISMDATTWPYAEGLELRYSMTDWADGATTHTNAKGMYLRMENAESNASGSITGCEVYAVSNNVANTQYITGGLFYAYIKGAAGVTATGVYAIQPEISFDAETASSTITEAACVRAKITGGTMAAYTNMHGYKLIAGDMNGGSRTYGNAFWVVDDSDMSGTCGWTVGLNLAATCTTGIAIESTTTAITFGAGDGKIVDAAASLSVYGGNTSGDALVLYGSSADSGQKITVTGNSGTAVTGTLSADGLLTLSGNTGISLTGTAITKGINFASAAVAMTDADNCLLSFGTWNDEVDVGTHTAHFVPFQVHIHSTSASAFDIAAMRLRVDTDGDNTGAALQVLQIRSSVSDDTASIGTMGAGLSIDAACNVDTGEVVCGGFSIAGGYKPTISGSNKCTVLQACNWNTYAGTSVNYIFDAYQNGAGNTVDAIIRGNVLAGTATKGLEIVNTSGTLTTGISVTNATLGVTSARAIKVSTSQATAAMEDGYGVVEIDHTITGVAGSNFSGCALSAWVNIGAGTVGSGKYVCAQNNGIYESATDTTITGARIVFGLRCQKLLGDTDATSFPFSINTNNTAITALIDVNNKEDMGWIDGVLSSGTGDGHIPIFRDNAGQVHYVNTYIA